MMHVKLSEKQEQTKPQTSKHREIINIKAKINEDWDQKTIQRINVTKNWFFIKVNKIEQTLSQHDKTEEG
jgi:hypothetical protein